MRGKVNKPRKKPLVVDGHGKRRTAGALIPSSSSPPLAFSDLEVPVRPLLSREEEHRSGTSIQNSLARIARLLPRHPRGYRRFLARMNAVAQGGGLMFSWLSLRERMAEDLKKATRALERSEKLAAENPKKAWRAFESGVKVLDTYPLAPENLYQWAREVVQGSFPEGPLAEGDVGRLEPSVKVHRILRRLVGTLERGRDELVMPNFRLVLKEVFRYHPTGMRRSDLFQEGVLGLQKAVFRYDPGRRTRFSTYATYWIRQSIRKSLIDKSRLIRVPQAVQEDLRRDQCKLKPQDADRVRRLMSETMLFSAAETDAGRERNSFVVEDRRHPELGEQLHTSTVPRVVFRALDGLDAREREVLLRRFGLAGERPQTLEEIGSRMDLSRERIRQIERDALRRMKRVPRLKEVYEDLAVAASGNSPSSN